MTRSAGRDSGDYASNHCQRHAIGAVVHREGEIFTIGDLVEKPDPAEAPSNLAIAGRYLFAPLIFDMIRRVQPDKKGEIQLTDAIAANLGQLPIHGVRFSGRRFDCGSKEGFVSANLHFGLKHPEIADKVLASATEIMGCQS